MQIEIKLDPSCTEPKVTVTAAAMDETVRQIVDRLQGAPPQVLTGLREDKWQVLAPEDLIRLYAAAGKVYAVTAQGEYSPAAAPVRAGGAAGSPPVCPHLPFGDRQPGQGPLL